MSRKTKSTQVAAFDTTPTTTPTTTEIPEGMLTLKQAAAELGLSEIYVRNCIRKGQLPTTLAPIAPESKTKRHLIALADIETWRNTVGHRSRREDGRNKYTMYATIEEHEKVLAMINQVDLGISIKRANATKNAEFAATVVAE